MASYIKLLNRNPEFNTKGARKRKSKNRMPLNSVVGSGLTKGESVTKGSPKDKAQWMLQYYRPPCCRSHLAVFMKRGPKRPNTFYDPHCWDSQHEAPDFWKPPSRKPRLELPQGQSKNQHIVCRTLQLPSINPQRVHIYVPFQRNPKEPASTLHMPSINPQSPFEGGL